MYGYDTHCEMDRDSASSDTVEGGLDRVGKPRCCGATLPATMASCAGRTGPLRAGLCRSRSPQAVLDEGRVVHNPNVLKPKFATDN